MNIPALVKDLRGREIGRLTVREFAGVRKGDAYWICDCACGTVGKEVRGKNLLAALKAIREGRAAMPPGSAVSCGCQRKDPLIREAARMTMTAEDRRAAAGGQTVRPPKPEPTRPAPKREKRILPLTETWTPEKGWQPKENRAPEKAVDPGPEKITQQAPMGPTREIQTTTAPSLAQAIRLTITIRKRRGEDRQRGDDGNLHGTQQAQYVGIVRSAIHDWLHSPGRNSQARVRRDIEAIFGPLEWKQSSDPDPAVYQEAIVVLERKR